MKNELFEFKGYDCLIKSPTEVAIQGHSELFGKLTKYGKVTPKTERSLVIPEIVVDEHGVSRTVVAIEGPVFDTFPNLEKIYIPRTVRYIKWSFWECPHLKSIHVAEDNKHFCDVDGVLYTKDKTAIVAYPNDHARLYKIIEGCRSISNMAFKGNSSLYELDCPQSLQKIGINAFYSCRNLQVVRIPGKLISVSKNTGKYSTSATFIYDNKKFTLKSLYTYVHG